MSTLKAGRETDAAVAEKLGCWKDADGIWWTRHWTQAKAKMYASVRFQLHGADYNTSTMLPRFSESTTAAIAALEATGKDYDIRKVTGGDKSVQYVVFRVGGGIGRAPTLCLAACMAILQLPAPLPRSPHEKAEPTT